MRDDIKTFKFSFHATIGDFVLNAPNISSPITATWRRSNESVSSETVQMSGGRVCFGQTLTLPLNMYFDQTKNAFQQKKTMFTFNMSTPKGDKQAGVVYVEVAQLLNNKLENLSDTYTLEKCPVKDSKVTISITAELIGEGAMSDTMSMDSSVLKQSSTPSTLSIESKRDIPKVVEEVRREEKKQDKTESKKEEKKTAVEPDERDKKIEGLQKQVRELKGEKEKLLKELQKSRSRDENKQISGLKEELGKSKGIQQKLQSQINSLRSENIEHERELQKMRMRMEQIYQLLLGNLNSLY